MDKEAIGLSRVQHFPSADANIEQQRDVLKSAIHKACTETIGHTSRKHQDWFDENDGEGGEREGGREGGPACHNGNGKQ